MKWTFGIMAALMLLPVTASAQKKADPEGYLTYSLPSTVISIDVEAVQEKFYAGPYAKYAEKYLGIKPRMKDESACGAGSDKKVQRGCEEEGRGGYSHETGFRRFRDIR